MRNFDQLVQNEFQGGMNSEVPDESADRTELKRILNMIPSDDGHALILRPAFAQHPNAYVDGKILSIFPFKGWVTANADGSGTLYYSDDLLVVYENGGRTYIKRIVSAFGMYPADESSVQEEHIWSTGGSVPPESAIVLGTGITFSPSVIAMNDDSIVVKYIPDLSQDFMADYWVSEDDDDTYNSDDMGNNASMWSSESYDYSSDWQTEDWYNDWIDGAFNDARVFDVWSSENGAGITVLDSVSSTGAVNIIFPFDLSFEDTDALGEDSSPVIEAAHVDIAYTFPAANAPGYLLFSTDGTLDTAARYKVEYKRLQDYTNDNVSWRIATKGTSYAHVPVICCSQSLVTEAVERYEEEDYEGNTYAKVSFRVPWSVPTVIRITAVPGSDEDRTEYTGGAKFLGVDSSTGRTAIGDALMVLYSESVALTQY